MTENNEVAAVELPEFPQADYVWFTGGSDIPMWSANKLQAYAHAAIAAHAAALAGEAVVCLVTEKNYPHFAEAQLQLYGGYEPKIGDKLHLHPTSAPDVAALRELAAELRRSGGFSGREKMERAKIAARIDAALAQQETAHGKA